MSKGANSLIKREQQRLRAGKLPQPAQSLGPASPVCAVLYRRYSSLHFAYSLYVYSNLACGPWVVTYDQSATSSRQSLPQYWSPTGIHAALLQFLMCLTISILFLYVYKKYIRKKEENLDQI